LLVGSMSAHSPVAPAAGESSLAELAETYRHVDRREAVAEIAHWSSERVQKESEQLSRLARSAGSVPATTRLGAAALLTESALDLLNAGTFGRVRSPLLGAALLVTAGPPTTRAAGFEQRFFLLAGLILHAAGDLATAHSLLLRDLEAIGGDDPEILTALGAVIESVAALRQYEPSPDSGPGRGRPGGYASEEGESGYLPSPSLGAAESRYRRALALAPGLAEARLRLGRIRLLRGRPDEAMLEFERVAAEGRLPHHRYLALLFAGRALEVEGDLRSAADRYRAATAVVPQAQTSLLALERVLDSLEDTTGAQETLDLALSSASPQDPWWDYLCGQPNRLDGLLEELLRTLP